MLKTITSLFPTPLFHSRAVERVLALFIGFCLTLPFHFANVQRAYAQGAASPTGDPSAQPPGVLQGLFKILPLFGIVFMIFYFIVLRPQEREEKEHQELLDSLKSGIWLLTKGGLIGKVVAIEEQTVVLEISSGVKAKFDKSSIVKEVDSAIASSSSSGSGKQKKTA